MVSTKENIERLKEFFRYSKQELIGIAVAIIVFGFLFSFRDWGEEQFDLLFGLKNLFLALLVVAISFFFRLSSQKVYALTQGQKAEYKVWWTGIVVSLVIGFITLGRLPLVLAGGMISAFMVKQRLGEFRYGFSHWVMAITALWGLIGNLILAILFAVGLYFMPQSYFFSLGMQFNLMMAFCAWLPFPQQDGLSLFFGSRKMFAIGIIMVLLAAVLLLTRTKGGLIAAIVMGLAAAIGYILVGSEKD
jgi:hypothetical protein